MSLMNRSALNSVRGSIGMGQGNIRNAGTRNKDMANTANATGSNYWKNPGMQEQGNSQSPYNFSQSNPFGMQPGQGGVQPSPFPSPQPMGNPISQKYPPSPVQPPAPTGGQVGGGMMYPQYDVGGNGGRGMGPRGGGQQSDYYSGPRYNADGTLYDPTMMRAAVGVAGDDYNPIYDQDGNRRNQPGNMRGGGGGETGPLTLQQPMPTFSPPRGLGQRGYDAMVAQQQANRPFWMGTRRPATPPAPVKPQVGYDGNIDPPPADNNTSYVQPNFTGGY